MDYGSECLPFAKVPSSVAGVVHYICLIEECRQSVHMAKSKGMPNFMREQVIASIPAHRYHITSAPHAVAGTWSSAKINCVHIVDVDSRGVEADIAIAFHRYSQRTGEIKIVRCIGVAGGVLNVENA